jgi:hypothetical protein
VLWTAHVEMQKLLTLTVTNAHVAKVVTIIYVKQNSIFCCLCELCLKFVHLPFHARLKSQHSFNNTRYLFHTLLSFTVGYWSFAVKIYCSVLLWYANNIQTILFSIVVASQQYKLYCSVLLSCYNNTNYIVQYCCDATTIQTMQFSIVVMLQQYKLCSAVLLWCYINTNYAVQYCCDATTIQTILFSIVVASQQ